MSKVDCAIIMDCTGSMSSCINICKEKTKSIIDDVRQNYNDASIRYAFVGYRDFDSINSVLDFTEDVDVFKNHLSGVRAMGGADTCEDVLGGLELVKNISWKNTTRLLMHFADAPGHGKLYSNGEIDNHSEIDADGNIGKGYMEWLVQNNIKYTFCKINNSTDGMVSKFSEYYDAVSSDFKITSIEVDVGISNGTVKRRMRKTNPGSKPLVGCPTKNLHSVAHTQQSYSQVMSAQIQQAIFESSQRKSG
ncbi:vwkA-like alpha-protein kinase [Acrasis kona]|uniref:VwkA-like alpha-protein kinase n=1 Tax=Acrasis kona TaxID=1008807 RepID=A0AAW2YKG5_9EUKA